jgi:hypothetical protein
VYLAPKSAPVSTMSRLVKNSVVSRETPSEKNPVGCPEEEKILTISVPEAGRALGIKSKDAAYAAAHAGEIPVIKIGRLLRVPLCRLEKLLNGDDDDQKEKTT